MKRALDILVSGTALLILSPLFAFIAWRVWREDGGSPWFRGTRVARDGADFRMLKFRSMRVDAWKSGVNSTAAGDRRITRIGAVLRRFKLDELPQLWNVFVGDMSVVGPRPQVRADASLYTLVEQRMLLVRPGITDLASIVFSDEGDILAGSLDPDLLYNQVIRPWKSRLALLYVDHSNVWLDLRIIFLTAVALVSRPAALEGVQSLLRSMGADELLRTMAFRRVPLLAYPPPGAQEVVALYQAQIA